MKYITPGIEVFMTPLDERNFLSEIHESIRDVLFIEQYVWNKPKAPIIGPINTLETDASSDFCMLNTGIQSIHEYHKNHVREHLSGSGYTGDCVGEGLIQFLRSRNADYAARCLRNGTLSASYDPSVDPDTEAFTKSVWKILKRGSKRVYSIDLTTKEVSSKPETRFFAWPDAAERYNGDDEKYLTNTFHAYFVTRP